MKNLGITSLIVGSLLIGFACTNENKKEDSTEVAEEKNEEKFDTTKVEDDTEFMVSAASGGMLEVQLGEIAVKNAASAKVKEFAAAMVADHTMANTELKALAATKNISLPATPSDEHLKDINDFAKKSGAEFDKDYMSYMVDDHEDDIDAYEKEADKGNDADIKAFAAGKVPTLKHHLEMAKMCKDALK